MLSPSLKADLGGPPKQLAQHPLFDVLHLPDAGRQGGRQLLVDVWLSTQGLHHRVLLAEPPWQGLC